MGRYLPLHRLTTWFLRKAAASSLEHPLVCHVIRFDSELWFATPRTPPLWQRGFFLVNWLVLRRLFASSRSGVVKTFRCVTQVFRSVSSSPTNPDQVRQLVDAAIASISNTELVAKITPLLRPAVQQTLRWEYGDNEPFSAWRFADLGERNVWAAYCTGGHGALGNPWGLVFVDSNHFGSDFSWYPELVHLFEEWYA